MHFKVHPVLKNNAICEYFRQQIRLFSLLRFGLTNLVFYEIAYYVLLIKGHLKLLTNSL